MTDFRDKVIEEIQGWEPIEWITLLAMSLLVLVSLLMVTQNADAECTGTYHSDSKCLISVTDCWGAANHACRSKDQIAKCVEYHDNTYEYWNTTTNETQIRYNRGLCFCSYWCMNKTQATTSTTTTSTTFKVVITSTTPLVQPTKPLNPSQNITIHTLYPTTTYPQQQETPPPEQKQPPTPQEQLLLWLIILLILTPAAIEDIRTTYIDRRLTTSFTAGTVTYALLTWNTNALIAATIVTTAAYILWKHKHMGTADLILSPGATAALILLLPQKEEILVASVGTISYILFYLQKHKWNWKTEVPIAACLLTYYIGILLLRIGLQLK